MTSTPGLEQKCPICGLALARPSVQSRRVAVAVCGRCGHSIATHRPEPTAAVDYHAQYDQGGFLDALALTRRRQATAIIKSIRECLPGATRLVDFGAGRGFFLEAARVAGFTELAGLDSSPRAIQLLETRGFEAALLEPTTVLERASETLSFEPDVLTLLDVIEHFPAAEIVSRLRALVRVFRPALVVVKVPVSDGLLYRTARAAAALGLPAPLERLYQCGTSPPHQSYFSRRSLRSLVERSGLRLVKATHDRDFDARGFAQRVGLLSRLGAGADLLGAVAAAVADRLELEDSMLVFAVSPAAERSAPEQLRLALQT